MTQRVLVIDKNRQPLMPCHPARARQMLREGKAAVFHKFPFTIILKEREGGDTQPIEFKVDPGSKTTGIALVADYQRGKRVIWAAEIEHRGEIIKENLADRAAQRRRRSKNLRYRPARFNNRHKDKGWLPPSLLSRVQNILTMRGRLSRACPITSIVQELVKFDTQLMENAEISGIEYQQGTLQGYEVREYLLEKFARTCVYCGIKNVPFEIEHIIPKSRRGSSRVKSLAIACHECNLDKGNKTAEEYGHPEVQAKAAKPLRDAAAVNATRWRLFTELKSTGLPISTGSGGRTKFNRSNQGYPKAHWIDATCAGLSGEKVYIDVEKTQPLLIKAMGRQSRQMVKTDQYGFPTGNPKERSSVHGFKTGDIVKGDVPKGKYRGVHVGRIAIRKSGTFLINSDFDVHWKYCSPLHRSDGYGYEKGEIAHSPTAERR